MSKKSKHPRYDDPSAFGQRWPAIREVFDVATRLSGLTPERTFKMGKVIATLAEPGGVLPGYFLSVRCNNRYPTWDEIVWLRYSLIPDAAIMTLVLPNLNAYINHEDNEFKYVFTLEQRGWAIDPPAVCDTCGGSEFQNDVKGTVVTLACRKCKAVKTIDMATWNEQHGNGKNAPAVSG